MQEMNEDWKEKNILQEKLMDMKEEKQELLKRDAWDGDSTP